MKHNLKIFFYTSGHGFGHISRDYELIRELVTRGHEVHSITSRTDFFSESPKNIHIRNKSTDPGIVQKNSISMDLDKTLETVMDFEKNLSLWIEEELDVLALEKPNLIISDSSPYPFRLSNKLNIPGIFIGNFTWDFIFKSYKDKHSFFGDYANRLSNDYSLCKLGLMLPLSCPNKSIPVLKNVGFLTRKPTINRENARNDFGFVNEELYFLFSFGAYGIDEVFFHWENLNQNERIVVSGLEGYHRKEVIKLDRKNYPDIINACDCIITKPGYGILSEAIFTGKPVLYTDRGEFPEYHYLVSKLHQYLPAEYISQDELADLTFSPAYSRLKSMKLNHFFQYQDGIVEIISEIFKIV